MSIPVDLAYDPTWLALDWAKLNCSSYITNIAIPSGTAYQIMIRYYFSDEKEALMFQLKWASQQQTIA